MSARVCEFGFHICLTAAPQSTKCIEAVMKPASSEARKTASAATSSGVASRPSGCLAIFAARAAAEPILGSEFHVSRAVVRESLQRLAHERLVEQNSYKGTRVVLLSPEQIDEHLSARLLLETEVVRQAKESFTDEDRNQLKAMARKLESVVNNPQLYAERDLQLHGRIWELSGNRTFQKLLGQITTPLFAMGTITRYAAAYASHNGRRAKFPSRPPSRSSDHIKLVDVICDGTRDEAITAIQEHITHN